MNNGHNDNKNSQNGSNWILIVFACLFFAIITPSIFGVGGSVDVGIAFIGMYFVIIVPMSSIILSSNKVKILLCLINVVLSIFLAINGEPLMWLIVAWAILWGFISLLVSAIKNWNESSKQRASGASVSKKVRLSGKYAWIFYPFINLALELLILLFFVGIFNLLPEILGDSDGWGVLFMFIPVFIFFCLVIIPVLAVRYGKKLGALGFSKYLLCLYNAFIMSSWSLVLFLPHVKILFTSIFFWPSLIAGLIAAAVSNKKSDEVASESETTEIEATTEITEASENNEANE